MLITWTSCPIQLFVIVYLLVFIASQISAPTSAAFNDVKTVEGSLAAASEAQQGRDHGETDEQTATHYIHEGVDKERPDKETTDKERGQDEGADIDDDEKSEEKTEHPAGTTDYSSIADNLEVEERDNEEERHTKEESG